MTRIETYAHDGLTFHVRDEGPIDGEPVVLLHGFPQRASSWDGVAPLLHEAGLRTIAPDQRGYSPGARPRRRRDYAFGPLVGDAEALLAAIGRPAHVVGHDWGASVAWLLAARRPELVPSLVAVSEPHPAAFLGAMVRSNQALKSWYMAAFQLPRLPERALSTARGEQRLRDSGMTEAMIARYRTEIVEDGALRGGLGWYRAMPFARPAEVRAPVTVPTTLVWSDGDVAVTRASADLCRRWVRGDYELRVLPGVSHWIPDEAPRAVADAVLHRVGHVPR